MLKIIVIGPVKAASGIGAVDTGAEAYYNALQYELNSGDPR